MVANLRRPRHVDWGRPPPDGPTPEAMRFLALEAYRKRPRPVPHLWEPFRQATRESRCRTCRKIADDESIEFHMGDGAHPFNVCYMTKGES